MYAPSPSYEATQLQYTQTQAPQLQYIQTQAPSSYYYSGNLQYAPGYSGPSTYYSRLVCACPAGDWLLSASLEERAGLGVR